MNQSIDPVIIDNEIAFTRYLYTRRECAQSLFISLLNRNCEEALFWGYELYFSGFQEETVEYLISVYDSIYVSINSVDFNNFIKNKYDEWIIDTKNDILLGIIIRNMVMRDYDINDWVERYFNVKCSKGDHINKNKNIKMKMRMRMRITMINIDRFRTIGASRNCEAISGGERREQKCSEPGVIPARSVLKQMCKYKLHKEVNDLFQTNLVDLKSKYYNNWLFYAYASPIWRDRIIKYGGSPNYITHKIEFGTDNIESEEDFNELYNYETDEQLLEVQEKSIGNGSEKQLSIKEFSQKYGGNLICKIRKHRS